MTCARVILFAEGGWVHREESECTSLEIAWPPQLEEESDEAALPSADDDAA